MPLRGHLVEARRRAAFAAIGLALGGVVGWMLYSPVLQALQAPLVALVNEREGLVALNFSGLATPLDLKVQVSLFLGVLVSSPWWIYQLWAFIVPGLTRRERRSAILFMASAVPLFITGAYMASRVLPHAVVLLVAFTPDNAANLIDASQYLGFVMRLIIAFGLAFLLPVVMVTLNQVGVVSAQTWAASWRWAVLSAFVFSAVMTPTPDAISMIAMALPICGLYAGALAICVLHDRRHARSISPTDAPHLVERAES